MKMSGRMDMLRYSLCLQRKMEMNYVAVSINGRFALRDRARQPLDRMGGRQSSSLRGKDNNV